MAVQRGLICPSCGHEMTRDHPRHIGIWYCPPNMPHQGCGWRSNLQAGELERFQFSRKHATRREPSQRREVTFPINFIEVSAMLSQLKNFTVDRLDMDELLALSALGKSVRSEYQNREIAVPGWLGDALGSLDREILVRRRDELEKRHRDIKAQLATLETATEKRERLLREAESLEKQLAGTPA